MCSSMPPRADLPTVAPCDSTMARAQRFNLARRLSGYTVEALAAHLGVSHQLVSAMCRGEKRITGERIEALPQDMREQWAVLEREAAGLSALPSVDDAREMVARGVAALQRHGVWR